MTSPVKETNIQGWLRDYSDNLALSFRSSGRIKHEVTKGDSRENQILDALRQLLPTRVSVESHVVIVDADDVQSPSFDGVLLDRTFWPRIFKANDIPVVMIESIVAAIEVKSSINKNELEDIFCKSAKLRTMGTPTHRPLVTVFAYQCPNINLSFFDFSTSFSLAPDHCPSLICVLNQGLFGLAKLDEGKTLPIDAPEPHAIPVLFSTKEDTLLIYLYFLSRWVTAGTNSAELFKRYSSKLFASLNAFHFDKDFLGAVKSDASTLAAARTKFERNANKDIEMLYESARKAIGLS